MADLIKPVVPPIPPVPIVDPKSGLVTREWWRWFHLVTEVAKEQGAIINIVVQTGLTPEDPSPAPGSRPFVAAALSRLTPSDPGLGEQTKRILSRLTPPDAAPSQAQTIFRTRESDVPPDPVVLTQAIFRAQMMRVPGI